MSAELMVEHVRELLDYDPTSGTFRRRISRGRTHVGAIAGSVRRDGYLEIQIDGKKYMAHRVAWLMVYGTWPSCEIDHRDGVKTNNSIVNLRECTRAENNQNRLHARRNNASQLLGVSRHGDKWQAAITCNRKRTHLGTFESPYDAHVAYVAAKVRLHASSMLARMERNGLRAAS